VKVIITFTFCCDNLWKSKFMAMEKPGKLGIFSHTLWPPCRVTTCLANLENPEMLGNLTATRKVSEKYQRTRKLNSTWDVEYCMPLSAVMVPAYVSPVWVSGPMCVIIVE